MNDIDISIIIPVYYNEGSIKPTHETLIKKIIPHFPELSFEFIYIDDGSKDKSYDELCSIKESDNKVKIIQFTRNFGQIAALYAGYEKSKGKACINIAADLQEPPELIVSIIRSYINKDAQIIAGKRIEREESLYRKKTSQLFYFFMRKLSFSNMPKGGFDIILFDQTVRDFLLNSKESNPFLQGQLLWPGYSVKFIPYNRKIREIGTSKWSFGKKAKYLLDGILNYSYAPLRFFSIVGIITFILGLIYSVFIVTSYFFGNTPFEGWAPLMIVLLLFSGLQLVVLGIIGEYLWRAFEQIKNRPKYIIKE